MKITVDLNDLWSAVLSMGGGVADFRYDASTDDAFETEKNILRRDIPLEDVDSRGGVLEVDGSQVLLYIEDHGSNVESVISGAAEGRRFHVADCSTLKEMRSKNRFDRYVVTNDVSGRFPVSGKSAYGHNLREGLAELKVCRNCLAYLNYKGYKSNRTAVHKHFSLDEFFSHYSTLFSSFPKTIADKRGGYADNWEEISHAYRKQQGFHCEACDVNLTRYPHLLHTHHINGVKRDNLPSNFRALCIDCHRKEPSHEHMQVRSREIHTINRLRSEQALIKSEDWQDVLTFVDTSYHGLLDIYRSKNMAVPEICYDIRDTRGMVLATAELAWPRVKKAISHHVSDMRTLEEAGWTVKSLSDALRESHDLPKARTA